jgi:hypothetical protein
MNRSALTALTLIATAAVQAAQAATISASRIADDTSVISISGEILFGDQQKFEALARTAAGKVIVDLNSYGGNLVAGLAIAESIHGKGYATSVGPDKPCASSCAIIWLAGERRYVNPTAHIGFHAASMPGSGTSGAGNALLGAKLAKMGFKDDVVLYVTAKEGNDVTWLKLADADRLGISYVVVGRDPPAALPAQVATAPAKGDRLQVKATTWVPGAGPDLQSPKPLAQSLFPH